MISCNVFGRPHPKYEWQFGSRLIKPNPFKYALYSNVLIVKRFDISDIGTYMCTGSNGFGSPVSANITVLRASMLNFWIFCFSLRNYENIFFNNFTFTKVPGEVKFGQNQMEAFYFKKAILNCNHVGMPKPNITWITPVGQTISPISLYDQFKYELLYDGTLKINNLDIRDAGIYKCSAHNQFSHSYLKRKQGTVVLSLKSESTTSTSTSTTTSPTTSTLSTTTILSTTTVKRNGY